ncbi:flagellar hook-basal body complex protein [candidate division KSB1 bacterium]
MMRALYSGVSGLQGHQVYLDVVGNNIANLDTIAFKSGRITFHETLARTLSMGSDKGINPLQVGVGVGLASIDNLFTQGHLQRTNRQMDLAIDGEGFFILNDGQKNLFTRAGNFDFDPTGYMVSPTNGYRVQGKMADNAGEIVAGTVVDDIRVSSGIQLPASATSSAVLAGNLDSDSNPLGTITITESFLGKELQASGSDLGDPNLPLYARGSANAKLIDITDSTVVTVDIGGAVNSYTYDPNLDDARDFVSLQDLATAIAADSGAVAVTLNDTTGAIDFTNGTGVATTLAITASGSGAANLQAALSSANRTTFNNGETVSSDQFSHVANSTDLLTNLRDSVGIDLGLVTDDIVTISGSVGGSAITPTAQIVNTDVTTLGDLVNETTVAFGQGVSSVSLDAYDGSIRIEGKSGTANAITNVNIAAQDTTATISRTEFDGTVEFSESREARNAGDYTLSTNVFDSLGNKHNLNILFTKTNNPAEWTWEASIGEPASRLSGFTGTVTFNTDGSISTFTYADRNATGFTFDPKNGADNVTIELGFGTPGQGNFDGLTHFNRSSSAAAIEVNGNTVGSLEALSIQEDGIVTGHFTNGVVQSMAQIYLANFHNSGGLLKSGENMWAESRSSGLPKVGQAGVIVGSKIRSERLESSNVDLATEFTHLIQAQRGFQASARVIRTGDQVMQETTMLKR